MRSKLQSLRVGVSPVAICAAAVLMAAFILWLPLGRNRFAHWAGAPIDWDVFPASVAVGTAVTRCPPHRPVLALLTHTVPTSDRGTFGVKAQVRVGLQNLDWWQQGTKTVAKAVPPQTTALAPAP
jgi:hypothetical protein